MKIFQVFLVASIYFVSFTLDSSADSNITSTHQLNNNSDHNQSKIINNNIVAQKIVKFFQGIVYDANDFAEINGMKKSE